MVSQTKSSIIIFLIIFCVLPFSCSEKKIEYAIIPSDSIVPLMHAEDIVSLISDSGITRYRLNAKTWNVFSENGIDWWYFPDGFYVEKFDTLLNVEASVISDTAYYFEDQGLWKLVGNVMIVNLKQEKFESPELYWNQKTQKVYSDSLVRFEQEGSIITVIGFESNQEMTHYKYYKIQPSVISVKDESVRDTVLNNDTLIQSSGLQ